MHESNEIQIGGDARSHVLLSAMAGRGLPADPRRGFLSRLLRCVRRWLLDLPRESMLYLSRTVILLFSIRS